MTALHVAGGGLPIRPGPGIRTPDGERFLAGIAGTRVRQNGCAAAAYSALYANVDVITEMIAVMNASRAYESDASLFDVGKTLEERTIDMGRLA